MLLALHTTCASVLEAEMGFSPMQELPFVIQFFPFFGLN